MTWEEAVSAFRKQVPVDLTNYQYGAIHCARIAEVGLRIDKHGNLEQVIGGMDYTEHCIYHGVPEKFELASQDNQEDKT